MGYGLFGWVEAGPLAGMYVAAMLGVTVGFHRLFTHRSFEAARPVQFVLGVLGSMTFQGPLLLEWVGRHRIHHRYSDRAGDPPAPHRTAVRWHFRAGQTRGGYNELNASRRRPCRPPAPSVTSRSGSMIPTHILTDLAPDECVAVLSRGREIHFHVHPATDDAEAVRAFAAREGSEVLASHLRDHAAIRALVTSRERDVGGEG